MADIEVLTNSNFETLIYYKEDGIAWVTLNRPQVLNVYNIKMRDELWQILGAIKDDEEVKAVIFHGAGDRAFCAGADLTEFLTAPPPVLARKARWDRDVWGLFLSVSQPLIAALHGYVLGSGLEIALCCDIRIVSEDAQFGLPETGLGIIPAAGGTQTLPRTIGRTKTLEMLFNGTRLNSRDAYNLKLVSQIVNRQQLLPTAKMIANKIARCNSSVLKLAKQAVVRGLDLSLDEGLEMETNLASLVLSNIMYSNEMGGEI